MSYLYPVKHEDEIYCIPETYRAKEVAVYKASKFPNEWERAESLLTGLKTIDITIFQHEGRWWMMFTDQEKGGDANLYVGHAPDFWGPWKLTRTTR